MAQEVHEEELGFEVRQAEEQEIPFAGAAERGFQSFILENLRKTVTSLESLFLMR